MDIQDIEEVVSNEVEQVEETPKDEPVTPDLEVKHQDALDILKQSVDRLLSFYCELNANRKDYSDDEFKTMEAMAVEYIGTLFPKLNTTKRALKYLEIYYQIYTLKQTQERRLKLLDSFHDVMQFCEKEELFLDACKQLQQHIALMSRQLDELTQNGQSTPVGESLGDRIHDPLHTQRPLTRRGNRRH
jgi:hypothetical protein